MLPNAIPIDFCFFFSGRAERCFPFWETKLQNHILSLFVYIFHRRSSKMMGKLEEERGGWGELSGQSGLPAQRNRSWEHPLSNPPSFSKDLRGRSWVTPAIKQAGVPEKIGSIWFDHLSKTFPISLSLKPRVSTYGWGVPDSHWVLCGKMWSLWGSGIGKWK